jgi:CRP-like cAMP-binding protein
MRKLAIFSALKKYLKKLEILSLQGDYIIREATNGDTFYIIAEGSVRVTKKAAVVAEGADQEEEIRTLARGDYFGEQVILI